MGKIGLDDIHIACFQQIFEFPAAEHALAGGNRRTGRLADIPHGFVVLAEHRLFNKHRVELFQFFG